MYSENENPEDSQLQNLEHEYELIKYLTKEDLIEANDAAIRERRNRTLRKDFVENLPDDFIYVSPNFFYNNKYEIRLFIVVDDSGSFVLLDVSHLRYNALPTAKLYKDGTVEYESEQEIELKRPYPNKREWQETFVRKPVRKQEQFRKTVLGAYGNQCAVCDVKNSELLRAAHIVPVVNGGDDSVSNGICLCVNHEIAFDKGLLVITPTYEVVIRGQNDLEVKYTEIRLPLESNSYPSANNLSKKLEILNIDNT